MAARKKKAAKKAVKKTAMKKAAKKKAAPKKMKRRQPESLRIRSITPGFTVKDLQRSMDWYTGTLGFVIADRWIREGVLVGVELKAGVASLYLGQDDFQKGKDRAYGQGVRIYCATAQDVDMLADGVKARGGRLDHDPQTQPWGERDFGITDPDGYKLTISSAA
jgi:uncharacterized glyoxalase superfamily protein PhnB